MSIHQVSARLSSRPLSLALKWENLNFTISQEKAIQMHFLGYKYLSLRNILFQQDWFIFQLAILVVRPLQNSWKKKVFDALKMVWNYFHCFLWNLPIIDISVCVPNLVEFGWMVQKKFFCINLCKMMLYKFYCCVINFEFTKYLRDW